MDTQDLTHIQQFYGWWQFAVCLFAFLALMAIWYHIGRKRKDYGQVWLGLSILCWSFSGGLEVLSPDDPNLLKGGRSILSLLNSLFILLALPWFKYLPEILQSTIQSKNWKILVGLPFLFSLLPTIRLMVSGERVAMMSELDVYYSILTLTLLGMVLWETFQKRRLPLLAYLSILCILITFVAQLYKLTHLQANQSLLSAIFKANLIMLFFALALSWVKELSESLQLRSEYIILALQRYKTSKGRWEHKLLLNGIGDEEAKKMTLSATQYKLLALFLKRKIESEEGWLSIKPKSETRSTKQYDINDYNEIKRLLHAVLDGVYGKGVWSKNQHEIPLKEALFERSDNRDGRIRLKIPTENISIDQD